MASEKLDALPDLAGGQAPDDLAYVVDISAGVTGSRKSTLNDLFSIITRNITDKALRWQGSTAPAVSAAGAGAIYFDNVSNTFKASQNGAAYTDLIGGVGGSFYPLTPVVDADFAWVNQGGATVTTNSKGAVVIYAPPNSGDQLRCRVKAYPAAPFSIVMGFMPILVQANFFNCGLIIRDSAGGACASFGLGASNGAFSVGGIKWNSVSSYNSNYYSIGLSPHFGMQFLKYTDDNTNRVISYSADGEVFVDIFSVGRTDFLTPNQIGFMCDTNNTTYGSTIAVYSWLQS
ncbi:MAG: hypothetical protein BWY07_02013 [Candidatus Hydrogenedentes bacterium ADurb.Bin170]|nr:MAG: hypothetical protein BWY07_02013 [Candidatus Hydrogenedentes bacterium ADurb.Bin170]